MARPTPEEGNQNPLQCAVRPEAHDRAEAEGIDLSLLRERLKLSPTERLESHKQVLISLQSLISEVNRARHRSHSEGTLGKRG